MTGSVAQIVALTCYGNAFLRGKETCEFFPGNSTCQFCDRVTFVTLEKSFFGRPKQKEVASSPERWFELIRDAGATGIRLSRRAGDDPALGDRLSAGFLGGGGTWLMEVLNPKRGSDLWVPRWEVWNRNAPDQRIWRVAYGRVSEGVAVTPEPDDLTTATTQLIQGLRSIRGFSTAHAHGEFTQAFANALETLESRGERRHGYHQDLAPEGCLSPEARILLDACQSAWVFGGMGSWNDMIFYGDFLAEYERVSEDLFQKLNVAMAVAANQSL